MNKWVKRIVIPIGVIGLVAGLSACGHHTEEEKQQRAVKKISYFLELEDSQKPQAEALVQSFFDMRAELKANRFEELKQLKTAVNAPELDQAMLNEMINHKTETVKAHQANIIQNLASLHATMNTEQKEELLEMLEKMEKRMNR